jgi:hypothetical protein
MFKSCFRPCLAQKQSLTNSVYAQGDINVLLALELSVPVPAHVEKTARRTT